MKYIFFNKLRPAYHLVSFLLRRCPVKNNIIYALCFMRSKTSNPKDRSKRLAPVRTWQHAFLNLESTALTAPTEINLPYQHLPRWWGGGNVLAQFGIWRDLSATFCGNIMITLATGLAQQFYTYWQIYDNQRSLAISIKNLCVHF